MNLKRNFFGKNNRNERILYKEELASKKLANRLFQLLKNITDQQIVFICIGTDRSTGDSLGPLVGSKLETLNPSLFQVYGTLEEPIHAVNMEEQLQIINENHNSPYIIGIDACLGRLKSVGVISFGDGPVKPGVAVNKNLPPIGMAHITGIVNVSGFMEYFVLQNTRLSLVMNMATTIAEGIAEANTLLMEREVKVNLNPITNENYLGISNTNLS